MVQIGGQRDGDNSCVSHKLHGQMKKKSGLEFYHLSVGQMPTSNAGQDGFHICPQKSKILKINSASTELVKLQSNNLENNGDLHAFRQCGVTTGRNRYGRKNLL